MEVTYSPYFRRRFRKLPKIIQEEALIKISILRSERNLEVLRIHKLHGKLSDQWGFSITRKHRIIFTRDASRNEIILTNIGDHDVYMK